MTVAGFTWATTRSRRRRRRGVSGDGAAGPVPLLTGFSRRLLVGSGGGAVGGLAAGHGDAGDVEPAADSLDEAGAQVGGGEVLAFRSPRAGGTARGRGRWRLR